MIQKKEMIERRRLILSTIEDLVLDFLFYDRKGDEELPVGSIQLAVREGDISVHEITSTFSKFLTNAMEDPTD